MGGHLGLFRFDTSSVPSNQMGHKEQVGKSSSNGLYLGFYWMEGDFKPPNKSTYFTEKKSFISQASEFAWFFFPLFSCPLPSLILLLFLYWQDWLDLFTYWLIHCLTWSSLCRQGLPRANSSTLANDSCEQSPCLVLWVVCFIFPFCGSLP